MNETITITGNIATEPEHKHTPGGVSITTFRVASGQRRYDRQSGSWVDGATNWYTVSTFRSLADHAFQSLRKGDRVLLTGRLRVRDWETGAQQRHSGRDRRRGDRTRSAVGDDAVREGPTRRRCHRRARRLLGRPDIPRRRVECARRGRRIDWRLAGGGGSRDGCRGEAARAGRSRGTVLTSQQRSGWRAVDSLRAPPSRAPCDESAGRIQPPAEPRRRGRMRGPPAHRMHRRSWRRISQRVIEQPGNSDGHALGFTHTDCTTGPDAAS